jgi:hypothetical protein
MTEQEARKKASSLQKKLGKEAKLWRIEVFQNGGWYLTAYYKDGHLSLHIGGDGRYYTMFTLCEHPGVGEMENGWYPQSYFTDPVKAIETTRRMLKKKVAQIISIVREKGGADV